jgi:hypothetical protein
LAEKRKEELEERREGEKEFKAQAPFIRRALSITKVRPLAGGDKAYIT